MNAQDKPDYALYPTLTREQALAAAQDVLSLRGAGAPVSDSILMEVERFYRAEARLLDEEQLDAWYALLADDLFYWAPVLDNRYRRDGRPVLDPDGPAYFDERKADIAVRIGRVKSNLVWTEDPPTRRTYAVFNVEAFARPCAEEIEAHSLFIQHRNRSERDEVVLMGRRRDVLRRDSAGFVVVRRLILISQSILLAKNLTGFF
jgi:ethylbenzene dioxygenase subunit beta